MNFNELKVSMDHLSNPEQESSILQHLETAEEGPAAFTQGEDQDVVTLSQSQSESLNSKFDEDFTLAMPVPRRIVCNDLPVNKDVHESRITSLEDELPSTWMNVKHDSIEGASYDERNSGPALDFSPETLLISPILSTGSAFNRLESFVENWIKENPTFLEVVVPQTEREATLERDSATEGIKEVGTQDALRLTGSGNGLLLDYEARPEGLSTVPSKLSITIPPSNTLHLEAIGETPVEGYDLAEVVNEEIYEYFDMSGYFMDDSDGVKSEDHNITTEPLNDGDSPIMKSDSNVTLTNHATQITLQSEELPQRQYPKVQFVDSASPPPKRTSAQLLETVLRERPHLNLTGKIEVAEKAKTWAFGGFADVYQGVYVEIKKYVAVKRLRLNIRASEKVTKDLAKELRIWAELDHPNVLPLLGYIIHAGSNCPSLVSEWMVDGSLRDCMKNLKRYEALSMILGIAKGLAYLHSKDIIHSDLKTDNVLVSSDKEALLTDFGISQMTSLSTGYSSDTIKGSARWQAPEFFILREGDEPPPAHTIATDIWAFGMTIYELLSYNMPYAHIHDRDQVTLVVSKGFLPRRPKHLDDSTGLNRFLESKLWNVCERCWDLEPEARPPVLKIVEELQEIDRCKDSDMQIYSSNLLNSFRNA
ncbi:kinase-like protein [Schizopora paradoxa]|uniref:Kinase-like protein n=1 Tax=Schizopora paradoxa TaxID=27342 RepID=A0A0H2RDA9_9AGAM|nr:kinase-like protein [Schizopora paradoxa]